MEEAVAAAEDVGAGSMLMVKNASRKLAFLQMKRCQLGSGPNKRIPIAGGLCFNVISEEALEMGDFFLVFRQSVVSD